MSTKEAEARDAYLAVEVQLPNGTVVRGKPVSYVDAMRMLVMSEDWERGAVPTKEDPRRGSLLVLLQRFHELTGITHAQLADCSLGEAVDVMRRFFFQRRPEQSNGVSPGSASAPVGP